MRILKISKLLLLVIGLVIFNGCVEDDDYNLPNISVHEVVFAEDDQIIDIDAVLGNYNQNDQSYTFEDNPNYDIYTYGYVISSDEGGNFFEEIVIQDKAESPTAGVVVQIDVNPLFTLYEFGRKVFIKLDGLTITEDNGVLKLGTAAVDGLEKIPGPLRNKHIILDPEVLPIIPLDVEVSDFSNDMENLYIRLNDMQFNANDVLGENPLTFAAEDTDEFNGERNLENCSNSASVIMSTSTFSNFKSLLLPTNRGSISGVLTRDFFDDFYTIIINSPEDINFNNSNRCDPVFEESFTSATDNTTFNFNGWLNFAEAGSELWTEDVFSGNGTARFSAFSSGDSLNIAWLITPPFNMDAQDGEILTFQMQHAYPDASHDPIELLYSTDFDGTETNITSATWVSVPFTKSYIVDSGIWFTFVSSGNIDLSTINGTVYIAFKYTGSDTANENMTIDIDNFKITAP